MTRMCVTWFGYHLRLVASAVSISRNKLDVNQLKLAQFHVEAMNSRQRIRRIKWTN